MGKAISTDIRELFRWYIDTGSSGRAAGRIVMISPASAVRLAKKIREGQSLEPKAMGRKPGTGKLAPYEDFLVDLVKSTPSITLYELRDTLLSTHGVKVHHSSVDSLLKRVGLSYKKKPGS